jgi:hypothetical protein
MMKCQERDCDCWFYEICNPNARFDEIAAESEAGKPSNKLSMSIKDACYPL